MVIGEGEEIIAPGVKREWVHPGGPHLYTCAVVVLTALSLNNASE